jgi:hypothetical protein
LRAEASRFAARQSSCKSNRAAIAAREEFPDERREGADGVSESEDRARRARERDSESRARDQDLERVGDSSPDVAPPAAAQESAGLSRGALVTGEDEARNSEDETSHQARVSGRPRSDRNHGLKIA